MRKLIVSNLATLDGYYEGMDKSADSLFEYFHEDYSGDQNFDCSKVAHQCRSSFCIRAPGKARAICWPVIM